MTAAVLDPPQTRTLEPAEPERGGRADTPAPDPDASDEELAGLVRAGLAAREVLVNRHKPLVFRLAQKLYLPPPLDRDDVTQAGLIALARAVEKWNPDRGVKLCSYAGTAAFNAMRRFAGQDRQFGERCTSLDIRPFDPTGRPGGTVADLIPAPERPDPEVAAEVRRKVAKLPGVYRVIVTMHFGLDGEPQGWNAIADRTGLSVPQAKRALEVALERM